MSTVRAVLCIAEFDDYLPRPRGAAGRARWSASGARVAAFDLSGAAVAPGDASAAATWRGGSSGRSMNTRPSWCWSSVATQLDEDTGRPPARRVRGRAGSTGCRNDLRDSDRGHRCWPGPTITSTPSAPMSPRRWRSVSGARSTCWRSRPTRRSTVRSAPATSTAPMSSLPAAPRRGANGCSSELVEFGLALWGPGWRQTSLRDYCRGEAPSTGGIPQCLRRGHGRDQHPPCRGRERSPRGVVQPAAVRTRGDRDGPGGRRSRRPAAVLRGRPTRSSLSRCRGVAARLCATCSRSRRGRAARRGLAGAPAAGPHLHAPPPPAALRSAAPDRSRRIDRQVSLRHRAVGELLEHPGADLLGVERIEVRSQCDQLVERVAQRAAFGR